MAKSDKLTIGEQFVPSFVSGTFDLFNGICEQHQRNSFNPFKNGKKNSEFDDI